eukprot:jgi/Mesvir1/24783/Mv22036-RA.2
MSAMAAGKLSRMMTVSLCDSAARFHDLASLNGRGRGGGTESACRKLSSAGLQRVPWPLTGGKPAQGQEAPRWSVEGATCTANAPPKSGARSSGAKTSSGASNSSRGPTTKTGKSSGGSSSSSSKRGVEGARKPASATSSNSSSAGGGTSGGANATTRSRVSSKTGARVRDISISNKPADVEDLEKQPHLYYDHAIVTVRSGDGGNGVILPYETQFSKTVKGGKQVVQKRLEDDTWQPPIAAQGGDIVVVCDPHVKSLLHLHKTTRFMAKKGANADITKNGSYLPPKPPPTRVPVPPGTIVKTKRGRLLADLTEPGMEVVAAKGGMGGISTVSLSKGAAARRKSRQLEAGEVVDDDPKILIVGQPGEEVALELTMRVVADVGLVGYPNAGKSSLLRAASAAKPEVAPYPFTTLMPNLGVVGSHQEVDFAELEVEELMALSVMPAPVIADLPGLIEGAHVGRGLGRMFLRHLSRTKALIYVVDLMSPDPLHDYLALREELRMYNPGYVERPHIVLLNKLDMPGARDRLEAARESILQCARVSLADAAGQADAARPIGGAGAEDSDADAGAADDSLSGEGWSLHGGPSAEANRGEDAFDYLEGEEEEEEEGEGWEGGELGHASASGTLSLDDVWTEGVEDDGERDRGHPAREGGGAAGRSGLVDGPVMGALPRVTVPESQRPLAVIGVSAKDGDGVDYAMEVVRSLLADIEKKAKASRKAAKKSRRAGPGSGAGQPAPGLPHTNESAFVGDHMPRRY